MKIMKDGELELAPIEAKFAATLFEIIDRERSRLRTWLGWVDSTTSVGHIETFIQSEVAAMEKKTGITFVVLVNGEVAGLCSFHTFDWRNRNVLLGYWVSEKFVGKGYIRRASKLLTDMAFNELGLHRVGVRCASGNTRSQAIPLSLGFRFEGCLKQSELVNGAYNDVNIYGLLKSQVGQTKK